MVDAGDISVTAKPVVTDGDLNLEVLDVAGPLPKDAVQTALNDLTKKLNDNYPLGIHADSVEVTDTRSRRQVLQPGRVDSQGGRQPLFRAAVRAQRGKPAEAGGVARRRGRVDGYPSRKHVRICRRTARGVGARSR